MPNPVLSSVETLGGLGLFCAIGLVIARRFLHVSEDPRVKEIESILPGINCGACGFSGCRGYAEALLEKGVKADCCAPGGEEVAGKLARFLGRELSLKDREVSVLICQGGTGIALEKYTYQGIKDCRAALLVQNGPKVCPFGCVGLGTCAAVCPFDAITMGEDNLPVIDPHKCTACGAVRRFILHALPMIQGKRSRSIVPGGVSLAGYASIPRSFREKKSYSGKIFPKSREIK